MQTFFVRNLSWYWIPWTKSFPDLELVSGLSHTADTLSPLIHMEGCAKAIVAKAKEAGVVLTGAGATYPYGKDPKDSNIRIAPSFPTLEDLGKAAQVFVLCVKLTSVEKLLG